mmetsp:Transcript_56619/g.158848  ORF Transcript_56619/g.158848 Transcript_56619/m.158848 type:complete len:279 (-) Transcript_56619:71-907(-)
MGRTRKKTRMLPFRSRIWLCNFFLSSTASLYFSSMALDSSPSVSVALATLPRSPTRRCFVDCTSALTCCCPSRTRAAASCSVLIRGPSLPLKAWTAASLSASRASASLALAASRPFSSSCCCKDNFSPVAAAIASSCRRFCAASASTRCCPCAALSLASTSRIRSSKARRRSDASASAFDDPILAPLEASAQARVALNSPSKVIRRASTSSKRCCSFRMERSVFSAVLSCGARLSAASARRQVSATRPPACAFSTRIAAARNISFRALARPSAGRPAT